MKITKVKSTLSGKMVAEGKPEGSVPLLVIRQGEDEGEGEGEVVIGSLKIISYFESLSPTPASIPRNEQLKFSKGTLSGQTLEEIAQIKEINILIEEATASFEHAAKKGSAMFAFLEKRDGEASKLSLNKCREILSTINSSSLISKPKY